MKALLGLGIASAAIAALAALHDANAVAQMYKCVDGGRTVYQQQACAAGAEAESAASSAAHPALRVEAGAASSAAAATRRVKPPWPASSGPATPR